MNIAMIPPIENIPLPWACPQCQQHASAARHRARENTEFVAKITKLSDREREIMLAICMGEAPAVTAERIHISVKTISTYRQRVIEKLALKSNAEIAVACDRAGLLDTWTPG